MAVYGARMGSALTVLEQVRKDARLARVVVAYGAFIVSEYAAWVAVLVYAYARGGSTEAGVIALVQLLPGTVVGPVVSRFADRRPALVLAGGYFVQAGALALTAASVAVGSTWTVYAAAVVASTAMVVTRPAQMALLPSLADGPDELTAASVALGWMENGGIVGAGLLGGLLLTASGPSAVLTAAALLSSGAGLLALMVLRAARTTSRGETSAGDRVVDEQPPTLPWAGMSLIVAVLSIENVLVAALDVLFVVLAVDVLMRGEGWAGYLQMAFGLGGVAAAPLTARLVGRRLGGPVVIAALATGAAVALTAARPGAVCTLAVLLLAGAARAVLDVAARSMLQRVTPSGAHGRVFGVVEGCTTAGLALGSLLVPALVALGGDTLALVGAAAILPLATLALAGPIVRLEASAPDHSAELAALRATPLFAALPLPQLEQLAASLQRVEVPAGANLITEGGVGMHYFLVTEGQIAVSQGRRHLRDLGPGTGVGEIALLRDVPCTATVRATSPVVAFQLAREPFLATITGNAEVRRRATDDAERWEPSDPTD